MGYMLAGYRCSNRTALRGDPGVLEISNLSFFKFSFCSTRIIIPSNHFLLTDGHQSVLLKVIPDVEPLGHAELEESLLSELPPTCLPHFPSTELLLRGCKNIQF